MKTRKASTKDFQQLQNYMSEFGDECKGGILIAKDFPQRINIPNNIMAMKYSFENMDRESEYAFEELFNMLNLEVMQNGRS